uniref:Uncharacterized protein n=1 Tax=Tetraselmis sp. GSL018 TaxID=582737 RepID=A0A061SBP6_9CHLO
MRQHWWPRLLRGRSLHTKRRKAEGEGRDPRPPRAYTFCFWSKGCAAGSTWRAVGRERAATSPKPMGSVAAILLSGGI